MAVEMAQLVNCLPQTSKDLSLIPKTHIMKKPALKVHACNPRNEVGDGVRVEKRGSPQLPGQSP